MPINFPSLFNTRYPTALNPLVPYTSRTLSDRLWNGDLSSYGYMQGDSPVFRASDIQYVPAGGATGNAITSGGDLTSPGVSLANGSFGGSGNARLGNPIRDEQGNLTGFDLVIRSGDQSGSALRYTRQGDQFVPVAQNFTSMSSGEFGPGFWLPVAGLATAGLAAGLGGAGAAGEAAGGAAAGEGVAQAFPISLPLGEGTTISSLEPLLGYGGAAAGGAALGGGAAGGGAAEAIPISLPTGSAPAALSPLPGYGGAAAGGAAGASGGAGGGGGASTAPASVPNSGSGWSDWGASGSSAYPGGGGGGAPTAVYTGNNPFVEGMTKLGLDPSTARLLTALAPTLLTGLGGGFSGRPQSATTESSTTRDPALVEAQQALFGATLANLLPSMGRDRQRSAQMVALANAAAAVPGGMAAMRPVVTQGPGGLMGTYRPQGLFG